ncbi:MAG: hypothetical protein UT24_C0003G0004 [Candidatus Woesebacteria bacterium GW2011_GWB1_39_12]|uniref:Uncharacterized protein n=1 Tax=Candidatus Woesebacteria bacterium GW2011_GWB1_39_12 TaxID=1618574 RepID=A0A0G0QIU8_9BACT|nr:MAG: hypothetical protein UT24_C0003G0004 [Candidatus Woesebacteria bacterium GW2011_GWB1_39_12]
MAKYNSIYYEHMHKIKSNTEWFAHLKICPNCSVEP